MIYIKGRVTCAVCTCDVAYTQWAKNDSAVTATLKDIVTLFQQKDQEIQEIK